MSDSFADLWNSAGSSKPEKPRTLGTLSTGSSTTSFLKPQNDVFSMLAATGSSSSVGSRNATPSQRGPSPAIPTQASASANRTLQKAVSTGTDAFGDLLSGTFASTSNGANMTIAERAAKAERERLDRLQQHHKTTQHHASPWAGLDSLGSRTSVVAAAPSDNDWIFDAQPAKAPSSSIGVKASSSEEEWAFDDFSAPSAIAKSQSLPHQSSSLLGLDEFDPPPVPQSSRHSPRPPSRSNTPGDFDFGNREDALLDDDSNDEDDILGALSKPAGKLVATADRSARASPIPSGQQSRAVSPPPHILGQIVEMGFSIQQARIALAATDTGLDVQAALETLLSNGAGSQPADQPAPTQERTRTRQQRPRYDDSDDDGEVPPPTQIPPRRRDREPAARDGGASAADTQRVLQEHADKLVAQASEIGLNLFNRANAFWKEGKVKVQKAYEEHAGAKGGNTEQSTRNGRPKWMRDAEGDDEAEMQSHDSGAFKDDDEHVPPAKPFIPTQGPESRSQLREGKSQSTSRQAKSTGDLLLDDHPAVYVSPFRRKAPSRSQTNDPSSSTPKAPPKLPSPPPLIQRKTIPAAPSAIATSEKHKAAGSEMFKLGRYAEAETSYSSAIASLPESHLLQIPLLNNRALTRIKTGDYSGAIDDCTAVVALIGPSYHPAREAKITGENVGANVDLSDALVKALRRRAEAYEGKEKWDAARQDWETLAGTEWAGKSRAEAVRGVGRCRRMLTTDAAADGAPPASAPAASKPKPKPKPKPSPAQRGPTPPSEALNKVREANQAAEAEDQARYELKDGVDRRLLAWKEGKETNIRALIASLETVLWPELGWQKVGMHELVTPSQVKIRYTKAIAKLHPDKLNVHNTTLEQRMIANGVFGTLNEAWLAFKQ